MKSGVRRLLLDAGMGEGTAILSNGADSGIDYGLLKMTMQ